MKTRYADSQAHYLESKGWDIASGKILSSNKTDSRLHYVFAFTPKEPFEHVDGSTTNGIVRVENPAQLGSVYEYTLGRNKENEFEAHQIIMPKFLQPDSIYFDDDFAADVKRLSKAASFMVASIGVAAKLEVGNAISAPEVHPYEFEKVADIELTLGRMGTFGYRVANLAHVDF